MPKLTNALEGYVKALTKLDEIYENIEAQIYAGFLETHTKDLPPDVKEKIIRIDTIHMNRIRCIDRGQEAKIALAGFALVDFNAKTIADILNQAGINCEEFDDLHFSRVDQILPSGLADAYNEECKKPLDSKTGYPAKFLQELGSINESFGLSKVNEILGIKVNVKTKSRSLS